ncbi:MAG: hypothetical protein NTZ05_00925, partial [Chloroflexi bacterium]|nr:hypothetical protein [Chloroflexota bacterium]
LLTISVAPSASPSAALAVPTPTSPDDGARLPTLAPLVTWDQPAGATQHHLEVIPAASPTECRRVDWQHAECHHNGPEVVSVRVTLAGQSSGGVSLTGPALGPRTITLSP